MASIPEFVSEAEPAGMVPVPSPDSFGPDAADVLKLVPAGGVVLAQRPRCAGFVRAHQSAVSHYVGSKNCSEAAFHCCVVKASRN